MTSHPCGLCGAQASVLLLDRPSAATPGRTETYSQAIFQTPESRRAGYVRPQGRGCLGEAAGLPPSRSV